MTAIANLPDLRPSLLLDFANSGRVDPRIQCTRASAATCFGPDGKLRTVAANVPRINYDPATGKCLGLLVEEGRTNLLTYATPDASATGWIKTRVDSSAADWSFGGKAACRLTGNTTTSGYIYKAVFTFEAGKKYTFSLVFKAATAKRLELRFQGMNGFAENQSVTFVTATKAVYAFTPSNLIYGIKDIGNGLTLAWVTATATTTTTENWIPLTLTTTAVGDYIDIAAMQLEEGSFPTSHIPTEASAVTRAADAPYITPIASPWFSDSSGTVIVSYDYGAPNVINMVGLGLDGGSSSNSISLATTAGLTDRFIVTSNGTGVFNTGASPFTPGVRKTTGLTWGNRRISQSANGGAISSVEDKDLPVGLSRMTLGYSGHFSQSRSNGHIARLAYYPVQVTDAQLQRLTA